MECTRAGHGQQCERQIEKEQGSRDGADMREGNANVVVPTSRSLSRPLCKMQNGNVITAVCK
jgi:hypothetical protein